MDYTVLGSIAGSSKFREGTSVKGQEIDGPRGVKLADTGAGAVEDLANSHMTYELSSKLLKGWLYRRFYRGVLQGLLSGMLGV